jgi:predicted nucleotidyltransferase
MRKRGLPVPRKKISEFCRRWNVVELSLFGSALREDFRPDSDVDVLVTFALEAQVSLFDLVQMQTELKALFKREVDLVEKESLHNPYRRREILQTAERVYAA